jgi:uncharacterized membrane protein YbhN (UPF0104 family)
MSKNRLIVVRVAATLILAALAGYFISTHLESIKAIKVTSWSSLGYMAIFELGMLTMNGVFSKVMLREFKVDLDFYEWFGLSVINTAGNLLLPFRGGIVLNGIFLKKRFDFPLSDYMVTVMGTYVVTFFCSALIGITGMGYLYVFQGVDSWLISSCLAGIAIILGAVMYFDTTALISGLKIPALNKYLKVLSAWDRIRGKNGVILFVVILVAINLSLAACATFYGFQTIGQSIGLVECLMLAIVAGFSSMLSILPANLGIREVMTGVTSTLLGVNAVGSVTVSLIERLLVFILAVTGSLICLPILLKDKSNLSDLIDRS